MPYVYKNMSDMDRVKWPRSFAVPQNSLKEGKQIALKKQTKNQKEPHPHIVHHPKVHYKINNILQWLLYTNALQIPGHSEL